MANFCSNCGAPLNGGKFCSECGTPAAETSQENTVQPISVTPDCGADDVLLESLFAETGASKIVMCKRYAHEKGIDLAAAKSIVDSFMATKTFSQKMSASQTMMQSTKMPPITKRGQAKQRIAENKANGVACCPKCGSTSLTANKKGFGIGKAVVGAALTGGIGLVAGNIGAKKVRVTCLNCGHQFMAGK